MKIGVFAATVQRGQFGPKSQVQYVVSQLLHNKRRHKNKKTTRALSVCETIGHQLLIEITVTHNLISNITENRWTFVALHSFNGINGSLGVSD